MAPGPCSHENEQFTVGDLKGDKTTGAKKRTLEEELGDRTNRAFCVLFFIQVNPVQGCR